MAELKSAEPCCPPAVLTECCEDAAKDACCGDRSCRCTAGGDGAALREPVIRVTEPGAR